MNDTVTPLHPLLEVRNLKKWFPIKRGFFGRHVGDVKAVDDLSFEVWPQETLALVGESGCGKTTVGRSILRLVEPTAGQALWEGRDLFTLDPASMRAMRRHLQIIFQDPYSSLNPRMTVGSIIGDALELHGIAKGDEKFERARELLERVGLQGAYVNRYPHEFSGGQRQRIGVARAIALKPKFIVCDEAVSALDVSVQAQVLNLLEELQEEYHLSYLFISHDLSVVRHIADRIAVMYLGRIVEVSRADDLFQYPLHPYTQALLSAVPQKDPGRVKDRVILQGDVPSPANPPTGCHFHTRCPLVEDRCRREAPVIADRREGHRVACHLYDNASFPAEVIDIRGARRRTGSSADTGSSSALDDGSDQTLPVEAPQLVEIPEILKERDGMGLGPFGEIIDPDDHFAATGEVPTLDRLFDQTSGVFSLPKEFENQTDPNRARSTPIALTPSPSARRADSIPAAPAKRPTAVGARQSSPSAAVGPTVEKPRPPAAAPGPGPAARATPPTGADALMLAGDPDDDETAELPTIPSVDDEETLHDEPPGRED